MNVLIDIQNLYTAYNNNVIHENINFQLYDNELVVLAGGSGSGKTSIVNFLIGESTFSTGNITFKNQSINSHDLSKYIALAPQNGGLLSDYNVLENIMLAIQSSRDLTDEIAYYMAMLYGQSVNLTSEAMYKKPTDLSGGMFRRAVLARALALKPEILIVDEPLAGLDHGAISRISALIQILKCTTLCITHIPIHADRYLILHEGHIYELNNHAHDREHIIDNLDTIYPSEVSDMIKYFLNMK